MGGSRTRGPRGWGAPVGAADGSPAPRAPSRQAATRVEGSLALAAAWASSLAAGGDAAAAALRSGLWAEWGNRGLGNGKARWAIGPSGQVWPIPRSHAGPPLPPRPAAPAPPPPIAPAPPPPPASAPDAARYGGPEAPEPSSPLMPAFFLRRAESEATRGLHCLLRIDLS
uniref:Uncharacterized protein n=1 Tax=Setaria viridis TaxID=4556 RepID=A0A4U6TIC6_SETVI|nr:hypothetical protein SEVIR_8G179300v2 [Setaria viridis]